MRPTRRANVYRRGQGAQRTSQAFASTESPMGGWNTRDAEDNVPQTDALTMDNWWPDLGEVRTRPGYTLHCSLEDVTTGADLISNGGFETAGAGGADVFQDWTESTKDGTVTQEDEEYKAGSYACLLQISTRVGSASVAQTVSGLTAERSYRLEFYDIAYDPAQENTTSLNYTIYDNDNSADIVSQTATGHYTTPENPTITYVKTTVTFETPSGCTEIIITFEDGGSATNVYYYLDAVSLYQLVADPTHVETLAEYVSGSNRDLIAVSGEEAFDVSSSTPVHLSSGLAAFSNARFQWANFDGKLLMVNGAEELVWEGSSLTTYAGFGGGSIALSGGIGNPIGINVFKNRVWYWEASSQDVWYTALNAAGGAVTQFPLSRVGQFGGNLVLMETWTRDGGSGPDDFAVFVMSSGEAIVYQGSYPGAAGDWALVGIYNIGEPLGYRAAVKFGGDLYIMTKLDVVRMSEVLQGVEARQMETKVSKAHRTAVSLYEDNWGWQAAMYPQGHMAIFNIPASTNATTDQHVQNTITGAWAKFKDIVANVWQTYDGDMYFGSSDGRVFEFNSGEDDNGTAIESTLQTAWLPIGGMGGNKLFKSMREAYKVNSDINVSNFFSVDFREFKSQAFPDSVESASAEWDETYWDTTPWSATDKIYYDWTAIGEYGERLGMQKRMSTKQQVTYLGASWLYETGARL